MWSAKGMVAIIKMEEMAPEISPKTRMIFFMVVSFFRVDDLDVLVEEDFVAVGIDGGEAGWTGGIRIGGGGEFYALGLQFALDLADVGEGGKFGGVLVPARIESEDIFLE